LEIGDRQGSTVRLLVIFASSFHYANPLQFVLLRAVSLHKTIREIFTHLLSNQLAPILYMRHLARTIICVAAICQLSESDAARLTSIMVNDDPCKLQCCNRNLDGTDNLLHTERGVCGQLPISPADIFVTTTSNLPETNPQQYSNTELLLQAALDGETETVRRLLTAGAELLSYRHQVKSVDGDPNEFHILYAHTDYEVSNILSRIPSEKLLTHLIFRETRSRARLRSTWQHTVDTLKL
jgi:hypothetical protein